MQDRDKYTELGRRLQGYEPTVPDNGWGRVQRGLVHHSRTLRRGVLLQLAAACLVLGATLGLYGLSRQEMEWSALAMGDVPADTHLQPDTAEQFTIAATPQLGVTEPHSQVPAVVAQYTARPPHSPQARQEGCKTDTLREVIIPQNRMNKEIALLEDATYAEPQNPRLYHRLALVYLEKNEYCKSRQNLAIARQLDCERRVLTAEVDVLLDNLADRTAGQCLCYLDNPCSGQ